MGVTRRVWSLVLILGLLGLVLASAGEAAQFNWQQFKGTQLRVLLNKHPWQAVDEACRVAHSHGTYRLRCVRKLIEQQPGEQQTQTMMPFIAEHPIIRPVDEYGQWIREALSQTQTSSTQECLT